MPYKMIDLFAGCGGLEDGFLQSGRYEDIAAVEWLQPQVKTLINRLETKWGIADAKDRVMCFDIQREDELFKGWSDASKSPSREMLPNGKASRYKTGPYGDSKGLDYFVNASGGIDIIIGGPPCQAYSVAGRVRDENGMKDDYRNYLFEHYLSVVNRYQPKVFVFENVPGLLSAMPDGTPIIQLIESGFSGIGWELRKYYARDYYLTYSSSWEDIGAIYKESAMRLIAPMVIRNQAGTLAEYKEWCESSIDEMWDFKGFLEKPFIKTPAGKTLSLSELTLKNSFFENLFWNIRNCFPRTESRIMSFYGRLFEMYIQDQIEAIANGQKKYLYIREFRYGKGGGNKSSDAYLRIDNKLLAIEAKGFSVLFDCIVNQNVNSNLDKLFIKPVLQADRAFDDNKSIEDFNSVTDLYVLSVTMDSINAVPDYYEHCKNDIEKRKRSTCLKKFYNINIEELEMLLFMVEKQYDIFELLDQYFAEKYMMPLSNYIKSKCPEVIKMTSFLSGVYEEASIKMKEAYGIV